MEFFIVCNNRLNAKSSPMKPLCERHSITTENLVEFLNQNSKPAAVVWVTDLTKPAEFRVDRSTLQEFQQSITKFCEVDQPADEEATEEKEAERPVLQLNSELSASKLLEAIGQKDFVLEIPLPDINQTLRWDLKDEECFPLFQSMIARTRQAMWQNLSDQKAQREAQQNEVRRQKVSLEEIEILRRFKSQFCGLQIGKQIKTA